MNDLRQVVTPDPFDGNAVILTSATYAKNRGFVETTHFYKTNRFANDQQFREAVEAEAERHKEKIAQRIKEAT